MNFLNLTLSGLALTLFFLSEVSRSFDLPDQLNAEEQKRLVEILGLGSSQKLLGTPYPLGGYPGFELSLSLEFINLSEVNELGCRPGTTGCHASNDPEENLKLPRLHFGKGLFGDVDLYLHFSPQLDIGIFDYGGSLRWSFYEAVFIPFHATLLIQGNEVNFKNAFVSQNLSADIVAGVTLSPVSFYFGGGYVQSTTSFQGASGSESIVSDSDPNVDPTTAQIASRVSTIHALVGVSLQMGSLFAAAQIDRYIDPVYSTKIGLRF